MQENWGSALQVVFANEGGYVNNPHDPGGATNYGITQRVFDAWRFSKHEDRAGVRKISKDEASLIYREQYGKGVRFDDLPPGIDLAVIDEAVNSGPVRAIKDLQNCLHVVADGHLGVVTLAAAQAANRADLINCLCDRRLAFLRGLKNWRYFGAGWQRRVEKVRDEALKMAKPL